MHAVVDHRRPQRGRVDRITLYQLLGVDIEECIYVGSGPQDPGFARRLGFICCDGSAFFGSDQDA